MHGLEFPPRDLYRESVEETHEGGRNDPNIQLACVDQAGYPVRTVSYSITGGNAGPFDVDNRTGSILVKEGEIVDYDEGMDFYNFTVECIDQANSTNRDTVLVNITILPVNEFFPELNISTIPVNVSETLDVGAVILSTVPPSLNIFTANDRDRGEQGKISYFMASSLPNDSFFDLNSTNGALVLIRSLDIDAEFDFQQLSDNFALLTIRVTACEAIREKDREHCPNFVVLVHVYAANEFNPRFSEMEYHVSVPESTEVGTTIIVLNCTDQDKGMGSFKEIRLTEVGLDLSTRNSSFYLENNAIILVQPLDYEELRVHYISLVCYDDDGRNDTALLTVNVTAVNELQPHFIQDLYEFTVDRISRVGTEIGRVIAVDSDEDIGGDVLYSLPSSISQFDIRGDGVFYLAEEIFSFESPTFTFTVTATDGEFNDTATVNIRVEGLLNVTEIALLATGTVVLLVIVTTVCLCCIFRHTRLKKYCSYIKFTLYVYNNNSSYTILLLFF